MPRSAIALFSDLYSSCNCFNSLLFCHLSGIFNTVKYWKKVTFNIFTRMVLNSYLLYKETVGREAMSRLQYISNIISEIEHEWLGTRENELNIRGKKVYGLEKLQGRNLRRCIVCSTKNSTIKRSRLICVECTKVSFITFT